MKTYFVRDVKTNAIETRFFQPEDFRKVGVVSQARMPVLEAHELVNRWNREDHQRTYFLGERN